MPRRQQHHAHFEKEHSTPPTPTSPRNEREGKIELGLREIKITYTYL